MSKYQVPSKAEVSENNQAIFDNMLPPLNNVLVRQAIAHAIDRNAIIDGAMYGYGTPIGTHFAPHNPAYVDLTAKSNYDPEKAKALLKEAEFQINKGPAFFLEQDGEKKYVVVNGEVIGFDEAIERFRDWG